MIFDEKLFFSILASIKVQHESEKRDMEEKFRERLYQVSEEFSAELTTNKEELQARHKKQLGKLHQSYVDVWTVIKVFKF